MSISFNSAISAYNNAAKIINTANSEDGSATSGSASSGGAFATLVEGGMGNSISALRKAETTAIANLTQQADITDVVASISKAESTLKTVIAVRDRLVSAFQEISKMPI